MKTQSNLPLFIAALAGGLSTLVGLIVLFGWHTHNLRLLHLHPAFVAMAYNAALGFFLCGLGLLAVAVRSPRLALAGGVYGVLFGSLTLGEYLFTCDFHIDELFLHAYTVAGVTNNARMAFNTALCFLLLGIFQLFFARPIKATWLPWTSALIGSLVFGMGAVAMTGYFVGIQNYYAWGHFTRMALHTALGFLTLGGGVLACAWHRSRLEPDPVLRWLPIPVGIGVLALTVSLWQALIVEQSVQLEWLHQVAGQAPLPKSLLFMNVLVPRATLGIGVTLATLLAWMVALAQANHQRSQVIGRVNAELSAQIQVRQAAEAALQQANSTLEDHVMERTEKLTAANTALQEQIVNRERLENQLLQAQKLESVGRLAGGIAHDFNNMLTAIMGYVELAEDDCVLDAAGQGYLTGIQQVTEKAAHLTRQLLAFARRQVIAPKNVNLNELVLSLDKLLRRLIGENIELVILSDEDIHSVKVDPGQFEQILVNLVVNARDAMPDGGKITIETHNAILDAQDVEQHGSVASGDYVLLAVSDTGTGMDEGIRLHIFEPFFTTKEKGRGTGLGLATVYGIVQQAGGHIWLYSKLGQGTVFRIYLPCAGGAAEEITTHQAEAGARGGSEIILLAEDETSIRTLMAQALRGRGYTVLEAGNGEEALRQAKGRETEIALLITDVIMPQMSGKELVNRLRSFHPALKIIYASGYTENAITQHDLLESGVVFLSKPFAPNTLALKVRETLDKG